MTLRTLVRWSMSRVKPGSRYALHIMKTIAQTRPVKVAQMELAKFFTIAPVEELIVGSGGGGAVIALLEAAGFSACAAGWALRPRPIASTVPTIPSRG